LVKITYYGHAAFLIEDKLKILIDPFVSEDLFSKIKADVILVTHDHGDHIGKTFEIAKKTKAKVFAIHEIATKLSNEGINAQGMNIGGSIEYDNIKISMVNAQHSANCAGFVVKFPEITIYHAGDTGLFCDMKLIAELYNPDIVMLPIGDVYTMGPAEAAKAVEFLKPKIAIPMHYGTFPILTGTPEKFKALAKNVNVIVFNKEETKDLR
jgi:L-ascorbate metabolism protein UlaG (beta-lactamase superfamily)